MTQRILIADDEPLYLKTTGELLRQEGYECVCVPNAESAIQRLSQEHFDLVLSDLNMPGNLKLELLHDHSRRRKHIPMIVITGVPTLPSAIESIRLGITNYLLKPVKVDDLLRSVRDALRHSSQIRAAAEVPTKPATELQAAFPSIIGQCSAMMEVLEIIDRVSSTDTNILITGESGTGKEVIANAIHAHSERCKGTFQVIDCTAIPESLFESTLFGHKKGSFTGAVHDQSGLLSQCDGGTAFFDELGELPLPMQAKLLRAVQEQTFTPVGSHKPVSVDTRFICATNRDLQVEIAAGRFRQDLFYRLGVIQIELPPLRNRGDDIVLLADLFLKKLASANKPVEGFSPEALRCLRQYHWPGNIRELRNVIEHSVTLCNGSLIEPNDLPSNILCKGQDRDLAVVQESLRLGEKSTTDTNSQSELTDSSSRAPRETSRDEALKIAEYEYLVDLLQAHDGNVSEAARQAGVSRQGLHKLLKKHDLHAADFR